MKANKLVTTFFALTLGVACATPQTDFEALGRQKAEAIKKIEKVYAENAQKIAAAAIQAGDLKLALKIKEEVGINGLGQYDVSFLGGDWVLSTPLNKYDIHVENTGSFKFESWGDDKVITFVRDGNLLTFKGIRSNAKKTFRIISSDLLQGVEMVNGKLQDTDEQLRRKN